MIAILKKELKHWFMTPTFYLLLFVMHIMTCYHHSMNMFLAESMQPIGLITIGLGVVSISREFKMKTYKLLFSSPVSVNSIILSKFLVLFCQSFSIFGIYMIIKMVCFAIFGYSGFVVSELILGLISVVFLIAFFSSIVIFMSCWGESSGIIFAIAYTGYFILEIGSRAILFKNGTSGKMIFSLYEHIFFFHCSFYRLFLGIFSLQSVGYFVVMTCLCLVLSKKFLESKRYL